MLIQPFMSDRSVVALHICVLMRLSEMNVVHADAALLSPGDQLAGDIFKSVVNMNAASLRAARWLYRSELKLPSGRYAHL
jgi:hypothetical protein